MRKLFKPCYNTFLVLVSIVTVIMLLTKPETIFAKNKKTGV